MTAARRWGSRAVLAAIWGMLIVVAAPATTDASDAVAGAVSARSPSAETSIRAPEAVADRSGPVAGSTVEHPMGVLMRRVISPGDLRRKASSALGALLAVLVFAAIVEATLRQPWPVTAAPPDATQRGPDLSRSPPPASPTYRACAVELTRRPDRGGLEPGGSSCRMKRTSSMARWPVPSTG